MADPNQQPADPNQQPADPNQQPGSKPSGQVQLTPEQQAELNAAAEEVRRTLEEAAAAEVAATQVRERLTLEQGAAPPNVKAAAAALSEAERAKVEKVIAGTGWVAWVILVIAHIVVALLLCQTVEGTTYNRFNIKDTTDSFAEAFWASITVFSIIAGVSVVVGGVIRVLIGVDGRFSTSYLQAYIWTIVLVWAFFFFIWVALLGGSADLAKVTNGLGVEYLLLLGGPFAALIAAKQIYATKGAAGDIQKIKTVDTSLKDVLADDRGRADLVDLQYLLFNFVALAFFFVAFARDSATLPSLPDGLVALTSTAALAYIGKKAVDNNRPAISSVALADGTGTPTIGDMVRIRGRNFVPAGAEAEGYLGLISVRFDTVKTPVAPAKAVAADPGQPQPLAEANVTATEILVAVPPMDLTAQRSVSVVVITAAGVETEPPYPLYLAPKVMDARFPETITAQKLFSFRLLNVPVGTLVQVEIGTVAQNATVMPDNAVSVVAPAGLSGTTTVILRATGYSETKRLVTAAG